MEIIRKFTKNQLDHLTNRIKDSFTHDAEMSEKDTQFKARIAQIIILSAGLLETIDPIDMDTPKLIEHLLELLKK